MRLNLEDLPPRYRAQAELQIAKRKKPPAGQTLAEAAKAAGRLGKEFSSKGEYEFYIGEIVPGIQAGLICRATPQVRFDLLPARWRWWRSRANSPAGRSGTIFTGGGCL